MTTKIEINSIDNLNECRYCSEVSLAQGEDPIGTAGVADEWLVIEVPRPWKKQIWSLKPEHQGIISVLVELEKQTSNPSLRLMAIAQDKEYSVIDKFRVFHYLRPQELFANYEKAEYLVDLSDLVSLVRAIILEPQNIAQFESCRQNTQHIRDILVCTHTQYDTACGRYGTPLYQELRKNYANENLRIWHTSHFGGHKFAPTLVDFPSGRFWGHLRPELLESLVSQQGDPSQLESCYRGWAGVDRFSQIAERAVWQQEGWQWFTYPRSGEVSKRDRGNLLIQIAILLLKLIPSPKAQLLQQKLLESGRWAEVLLKFQTPDRDFTQAYKVKVEVKGRVTTAAKSVKPFKFRSVKQYQVSSLERVNTH